MYRRVGIDSCHVFARRKFFHQVAIARHFDHVDDVKGLIRNAALLQQAQDRTLGTGSNSSKRVNHEIAFVQLCVEGRSRTKIGLLSQYNQGLG